MGNILFGSSPETSGNKPQSNVQQNSNSFAVKVLAALVMFLAIGCAIGFYLLHQSVAEMRDSQANEDNLIIKRLDDGVERYKQQGNKIEVLADKLNLKQQELGRRAAAMQKQQEEAAKQLSAEIAKKAGAADLNKLGEETKAGIGALSNDLAGTKKNLEDTRNELKISLDGTKSELGGAIARTHDELVTLAHKWDRDYFEFTLAKKAKNATKVGTVSLMLKSANPKKSLYTLIITANDKTSWCKDRPVDQPILLYLPGASSTVEIVVNKIGKESVGGYVIAPKGFFANVPNALAARPEK